MTNTIQSTPAAGPSARACYRHADALAHEVCQRCRRPICEGCSSIGNDLEMQCPPCVNAGARRSRLIVASIVLFSFVIVAAGAAFLATRPPTIRYGEHKLDIDRLLARVAVSPCDGQSTLELMELLNKERDFPRTIRVGEAFREGCQPVPRLLWASYGARMEVQDFAGAIADADALIADRPDDGDFWWWRAKARRGGGDLSGAEQDLRRSVELTGARGLYNALDLVDLLEKSQRACEAVPLLALVSEAQKEGASRKQLEARMGRLIRETPCPEPGPFPKGEAPSVPCATLPSALTFSSDPLSGFETSLRNTWAARTRTLAKGAPSSCRTEYQANDVSGLKVLQGTGMTSWTGRLSCDGQSSVTATKLGPVELKAQEALIAALVDAGIRRWCGGK